MDESAANIGGRAPVPVQADSAPFATSGRSAAGIAWPVLAVISAGGVLGALARYGLGVAFGDRPGGFAWTTFGVNVSGCLLIGVLVVLATDVWATRRLLRPFVGTGVLGGYTTFSTYIVDFQQMLEAGAPRTALAYLGGTLLAALVAVYAGVATTRWAVRRRRHSRGKRLEASTR